MLVLIDEINQDLKKNVTINTPPQKNPKNSNNFNELKEK